MSQYELVNKLNRHNWRRIVDDLLCRGYAQVTGVLDNHQCELLKENYSNKSGYRKTVNMQRFRFGRVLQPNKGDMIIFATNFRPEKGSRGFYRMTMKHGVSEVIQGTRYALGIIFHDAKQ